MLHHACVLNKKKTDGEMSTNPGSMNNKTDSNQKK